MQLEKIEPRTRSKIAVGLALVIPLGTAMITPAFASGSGHDVSASIVVKAIDRNGHRRTLTAPATAMSIGSRAHGAEYQSDAHGVIRVPAGSYIVGADIVTPASGGHQVSETLIARTVRAAGRAILTLDARRGRKFSVSLLMSGAQLSVAGATLCAPALARGSRWPARASRLSTSSSLRRGRRTCGSPTAVAGTVLAEHCSISGAAE